MDVRPDIVTGHGCNRSAQEVIVSRRGEHIRGTTVSDNVSIKMLNDLLRAWKQVRFVRGYLVSIARVGGVVGMRRGLG